MTVQKFLRSYYGARDCLINILWVNWQWDMTLVYSGRMDEFYNDYLWQGYSIPNFNYMAFNVEKDNSITVYCKERRD